MSSVFVQIGQGGNQLGETFFNTVLRPEDIKRNRRCPAFQFLDNKLRSVNVDSERKVINQLKKNPLLRDENLICGLKGCGSNWAMGYYDSKCNLLAESLKIIQKESEKCEYFSGIVILHSISGGTGSGFGSSLVKALRDEFPQQYILSCAILPYSSGETPLQHYNNILSLSSLQKYADGVVILPNDTFLPTALHKNSGSSTNVQCSLKDVNEEMSLALSGLLYPTDTLASANGYSLGREPWELLQQLCPLPSLKFISIVHQQKRYSTWKQCVNLLQRSFSISGLKFKSTANVLVGRGENEAYDFSQYVCKQQKQTERLLSCVQWVPDPVVYWTANSHLPGEKSSTLTAASNHGRITHWLQMALDKAKAMYTAKAYLHWYWKYGADKSDFEKAFEATEIIIENYREMACMT